MSLMRSSILVGSIKYSNHSVVIWPNEFVSLRKFSRARTCQVNLKLPATIQRRQWTTPVRKLGTQVVLRPYVDPKYSYAFGKSYENLVYSTIAHEFDKKLTECPDRVAFILHEENRKITFKQLEYDVNNIVKSLVRRFDVGKGDFVGVFAYNCYQWLAIKFACSRIGAILSPINPSYKSHELSYVLKKGKIKCLFVPGPKSVQVELNDHVKVLQSESIIDLSKGTDGGLMLKNVVLMDTDRDYDLGQLKFKLAGCQIHNWSSMDGDGRLFKSLDDARLAGVNEQDAFVLSLDSVSPDDIYAVYYTSGTTGASKGACISQFTAVNNVRLCQIRLRCGRQPNWEANSATVLPLFHIFAGVLNALGPLTSNTTITYPSHKYDIEKFVEAIIQHKANLTTLTPTILIDMLTYVENKGLGSQIPLQIIQPGGAALPPELVTRAFKILPRLEDLRPGYGSTENGAVATFQTFYEPNETRAHTVGPPIDFTEIRVVKTQEDGDFQIVPIGERGEVQTRGHNTMIEYLDDPGKTSDVITSQKWYRTGDIGFMHPHGSIELCGRLKNMIIKGGENIYPEEVEQFMHKMECIEKVHVVGVPDQRFGEQVCAWVQLKQGFIGVGGDADTCSEREKNSKETKEVTKKDIIKFCQENLTYFKVPKYLLFVDDFPMTATKKVQGHKMIERSIELLNLSTQKK